MMLSYGQGLSFYRETCIRLLHIFVTTPEGALTYSRRVEREKMQNDLSAPLGRSARMGSCVDGLRTKEQELLGVWRQFLLI